MSLFLDGYLVTDAVKVGHYYDYNLYYSKDNECYMYGACYDSDCYYLYECYMQDGLTDLEAFDEFKALIDRAEAEADDADDDADALELERQKAADAQRQFEYDLIRWIDGF